MEEAISVAAIVPCLNEEAAVGKVVTDLLAAVPGIVVYVYDNGSTDGTARRAADAGARVRHEDERGKGNVVRRAFADVEADVYLLVDGDDTYDIDDAPRMIRRLREGPYDHVLGVRTEVVDTAYRPGHASGNRFFNVLVGWTFRADVSDMLSGYRVMSRRFVKSFPALSRHFEIETELTVHAINARVPRSELSVGFGERGAGTVSKLRTYHDGFRILGLLVSLLLRERPLVVWGFVSAALSTLGLVLGLPVVLEFANTGLVPRFPTAILASGLAILSGVFLLMGVLLEGLATLRNDVKRLHYLQHRAPSGSPE